LQSIVSEFWQLVLPPDEVYHSAFRPTVRTILFNLCVHDHFDMQACIDCHAGKLVDRSYDEAELAMALAALPDGSLNAGPSPFRDTRSRAT
jgi:hypothetical protein